MLLSTSHSLFQVLVRLGQRRVEKMEETLLCPRPGLAIHLCHVQLQGKEDGTIWNVPVGWLHCGLHWGRQRCVNSFDFNFGFLFVFRFSVRAQVRTWKHTNELFSSTVALHYFKSFIIQTMRTHGNRTGRRHAHSESLSALGGKYNDNCARTR